MENNQINSLLRRFLNGLYMPGDIQKLKDTLDTKSGYEEVERTMDDVWGDISGTSPSSDSYRKYAKEAQELLNTTKQKEYGKRSWAKQLLKYAAIICLVFLSGLGAKGLFNRVVDANVTYIEVMAANKEHKTVILPDGTTVILNSCSSLRYPDKFVADNRLVEMKGEGFFQVSKDEEHPFIVRTTEGDVKVLGTSFNIKSYRDDNLFAVSVRTGKVEVQMEETLMRLLPDECLVYNKKNGDITKRKENVEKITSWIQGGLYFNNTPIQSIVSDLERMYCCRIELDPNCVFDETLFGEHDNNSLESVLKSIQYSTGIKYKKEGTRIVLYK